MTITGLEVVAQLVVRSDSVSKQRICELIGIEPTLAWASGDLVSPGSPQARKHNGWLLRSSSDPLTSEPDVAVRELLQAIGRPERFRVLPQECDVEIDLVIYGRNCRPSFHLSTDTLAGVCALGASLDVDIYDLSDVQDTGERKRE